MVWPLEEYDIAITKYAFSFCFKSCPGADVNRARQFIFTHGARSFYLIFWILNLSPAKETLV